MYLQHFQLKYQPFSEHTTVGSLWSDKRMEEGLARLDYLLEHGELGLVTGPSGVGKSALLKRFLSGMTPQQCETVYCHLTHLPSAGLLKMIVNQLGEVPRRGKERLYEQIQERAQRVEGTLLLVFDEAHLLNTEALTDLRLLISSALAVEPLLKILLVGQEPLRNTLKRGQHADLSNRISVRYQLRAFTKDQTARYLDYQIGHAGGDAKTFDESVKALIHDYTGGIPRSINNFATACLLQAASKKLGRIDDDVFHQAAGEFQMT